MAHVPNEIWLIVASYCKPEDLWLHVRKVNRQLKICSESHFKDKLLPKAVLSLVVTLPTYDMRNPMQGSATFHPVSKAKDYDDDAYRTSFVLVHTDPDFYRPRFMTRWKSMRFARGGGLHESMQWEFELGGRTGFIYLHEPTMEAAEDDDDEARLSFDWPATMTSFFRK